MIHDVRYNGQVHERCFLGSEFAQFCAKTFPSKFSDPLLAIHYGESLMGQDGMIVAVVGVRPGTSPAQCCWGGLGRTLT